MSASDFQTLLNVADVSASATFYGHFGFTIDQSFPDDDGTLQWCQLKCGDAVFMLNRQDRIDTTDRLTRPDYGDAVFYITVPDAHETRKTLLANGIETPMPEPQMYGVLEFRLRDPDGYEIAIGSRMPI